MSYASQARKEVDRMYRPATRELSRQEKKVKALDKKHSRDERAYQAWLKSTNADLNAQAQARDQQLSGQEAQYNQQLQANLGTASSFSYGGSGAPTPPPADTDGRTAAINDQASRVGGSPILDSVLNAQSAAFGGRLAAGQRRGLELSQSVEKNSYAQVAVLKAQRKSATLEALSELAKQRGDLAMQKAAETAKRAADMEAAAAEAAQREFENQLAIQKMNQDQFNADRDYDLAANKPAEDRAMARLQGRIDARKTRIGLKGKSQGATFTPEQARIGATAFATAVTVAKRRLQRARKDGERGKKLAPGDQAKLADYILRSASGARRQVPMTRDAAMAAAWVAMGGTLSKTAQKKLARQGFSV